MTELAPPTDLECLLASHLPPAALDQALALLGAEHAAAYRIGVDDTLAHLRAHVGAP